MPKGDEKYPFFFQVLNFNQLDFPYDSSAVGLIELIHSLWKKYQNTKINEGMQNRKFFVPVGTLR